ncbi:MAG TPA: P1 family peptidase [Pseudonocardiaceae bacterium]
MSSPAGAPPGHRNAITDVPGVLVGHHERVDGGWATGSTVVLMPPDGAVAAVDVRGGGPGTRETDLLDPSHLVQRVHAVVLTGGSAYGLAAADGVLRWLADRDRGLRLGEGPGEVVPIVPAAVLFDLRAGCWRHHPDASFGAAACDDASAAGQGAVRQGSVGAGAGARAGSVKGGVGTASTRTASGATVGALVAVNAAGSVIAPGTGLPWAADHEVAGEFGLRPPDPAEVAAGLPAGARWRLNTTIGVIATDAALDKSQCRRLAVCGHDGLARAVRPAHLMVDGDTLFAVATGARPGPQGYETLDELATAAADCVARAVVHGVLAATPVAGVDAPASRDRYPSAVRTE